MDKLKTYRYYNTGGLVLKIESDIPIPQNAFRSAIEKFTIANSTNPAVIIRHHFNLPDLSKVSICNPIYRKVPWAIYKLDHGFLYLCTSNENNHDNLYRIALFNENHTEVDIYSPDTTLFQNGNNTSLTLLSSDQILLSRLLADYNGCIFHSSAMVINQKGFLFVGHSGAGKSTISKLLSTSGYLLCDDRNIIRKRSDSWHVYGTWYHGEIPDVSPDSAPLQGIIMLEQSRENTLTLIEDKREIVRLLPGYVIKPLITADWWEKTLDLVGLIAREVPVYRLRFQKSERVIDTLRPLFE